MGNSQAAGPQLSYQVSPIILAGGVAGNIPAGMLPMLSLFNVTTASGLGLPYNMNDLDDSFGTFYIMPGGTLVRQSIATYPFANQSVAANAVIREPLTLSVIMDAPMRTPNAWRIKQQQFTQLKQTLDTHNNKGGTYIIFTPAYIYTNMIMVSLTDVSRGNNMIPQNAWRFDFERPLVALTELAGAQSQQMQKITNGTPSTGAPSGTLPGLTSGQSQFARSGVSSNVQSAGGSLTAGAPPPISGASTGGNFPPIPNQAGFPFTGIA
jgi:hypothetical protein